MKKYIGFIGAALMCLSIFSCQKDNFNYPDGTVGVSTITYYPVFTRTGSQYVVVTKGGAYTDPGITAKEGTNDLKVTTTGTVNTNVVGVYPLTYTAVNKDGYSATSSRTVIVTSPDATAAANNFSGSYLRASTGQSAVWTKIGPGVYTVNNPGGAANVSLVAVALNQVGNRVYIPSQISSDGLTTSSSTESSTPGANGTLSQYSWVIINPGYGTALRTFVKQ
jgi:hypothetical protein